MNIGIIGGGASGLFLAAMLEKLDVSYTIFTKGKIGNKILASGNGRCNIGNSNYDPSKYHHNPLALSILENRNEFFNQLKEFKIYVKEDNEGRMYPISESSLSVLNALLKQIHHPIIDVCVEHITKNKKGYFINTYGPFDKVVIACGSPANYKKGYMNLNFLNDLHLKIKPFYPSLVGFKTSMNISKISGVRSKCNVKLLQGNHVIHQEDGEVIFKDNGISGICIMNLSSFYAHLSDKSNTRVVLDLVLGDYDDYTTILSPKLLDFVQELDIDIHSFELPITGVYDFEFAQVCSGGVDALEVDSSLRLKKEPDIFLSGEVLDVDGVCGGYNLMFAFCCSIQIFKEIKNEISNR